MPDTRFGSSLLSERGSGSKRAFPCRSTQEPGATLNIRDHHISVLNQSVQSINVQNLAPKPDQVTKLSGITDRVRQNKTKHGKVKRLQQEHEATDEAMAKDIPKPMAVPMPCQFASSFLTPICRKRIAASVQISMPSCGFPSLVMNI